MAAGAGGRERSHLHPHAGSREGVEMGEAKNCQSGPLPSARPYLLVPNLPKQ